ncbi:MAG: hypothetical protein FJX80_15515 [Bacteroidetes bacterium]|nr:hypothetical protein [Bacteroidota bacterium]
MIFLDTGCGEAINQNTPKLPTAKKELYANDSIGNLERKIIFTEVLPGTENMMAYINEMVNSNNGKMLTNQQLGQIVGHFRANDSTIDKIINEGKNYPDQTKAKQIWNEIYNGYLKGDKTEFVKQHYKTGAMYHLNSVLINFNKRHTGNTLAQQYNNHPETLNLEVIARRHAAMSIVQMENTQKIEKKFKENLDFKTKKLNEEGFNISSDQVKNALNIIMNEYVARGYNSTKMREDAKKIDKLIEGQLGVKLKTSLINELFQK